MTRPQIDGDELEMLKELEDAEDVGSHKQMVETLIHEAYDEYDTGSYVYDPRMERKTPLSTDEIQEICWRYDAPAINPGHIMKWPRDRPDKQAVLAAICRYEGIDSRGGVKSMIRQHVGKGDPIVVEKASGEYNEDKRRPRNYHHYVDPILDRLEEHPPEEADNLPDGFHGEVEPIIERGENVADVTAGEWLDQVSDAVSNDDLPIDPLEARLNKSEELLEEKADHPHIHLIDEAKEMLEEEIERRRQSDDGDSDGGDDEAAEEVSEGLDQLAEAEEANDEDGRENHPDDRPEAEKAREVAEREGISVAESGGGKTENQQPVDDTDGQMVDLAGNDGDEPDS